MTLLHCYYVQDIDIDTMLLKTQIYDYKFLEYKKLKTVFAWSHSQLHINLLVSNCLSYNFSQPRSQHFDWKNC